MTLLEAFAVADAIAGMVLLGSLRTQHRNREAVAVVGAMLLTIAAGLLWIGLRGSSSPSAPIGPAPQVGITV